VPTSLGRDLSVVGGLRTAGPDVLRGEETQALGLGLADGLLCMPGTHSKWVRVENGRIVAFRTFLTGEIYGLLKAHSIVGRLIPGEQIPFAAGTFNDGVKQACRPESSGLLNDIFTARSGALLGNFGLEQIADRLSGIIIGHELRSGLALGWTDGVLRLVGEAGLCDRYRGALSALGHEAEIGPAHAAVVGFRRLAALEGESL
jgi:2-dehydro-3-deoxygalactonokinase